MKTLLFTTLLLALATCQDASAITVASRTQQLERAAEEKQDTASKAVTTVVLAGAGATSTEKMAMEVAVLNFYGSVQDGCAFQLTRLESLRQGYTKSKANMTAWGSLVTLIGGVTVYPPAKAVLMGIGISSGNDSSVLGGLVAGASENKTLTQSAIDGLQKSYVAAVATFTSKTSVSDPTGYDRNKAIIDLKAACQGLGSQLDTSPSE